MRLEFVFGLLLMTSFSLGRRKGLEGLAWLDSQWALVFRISDGTGMSAYDTYTDRVRDDDHPLARAFLPASCLTPSSRCCYQHYRSSLLNIWPSNYIDQLRVSVMKRGQEAAYILFNGTGSTVQSWFSADRVISSSWSDLKSRPHNFFSIEGHVLTNPGHQHSRRFYVFRSYNGCPNDFGWLSVQDQNVDLCRWGLLNTHHPFPAILFSTKNTYVNFNSADLSRADALTVAVKFLPLTTQAC